MRKKKSKETPETPGTPRIVMPMDIQQKEFRLAFRGYDERDVDEFLDELTGSVGALLEENRRLRGQGGLGGIAATDDTRGQADEILRQARKEADRIRAEARGAEPSSIGPVDVQGIPPFLARERDFLQGMAVMIQQHAETIREMAREARARQQAQMEAEASVPAEGTEVEAPAQPTKVESEPAAMEPETADEPAAMEPETADEPAAMEPETADEPAAEPEAEPPPAEETVRLPEVSEVEPAPVTAESTEVGRPTREAGQRSLRELFWGEED